MEASGRVLKVGMPVVFPGFFPFFRTVVPVGVGLVLLVAAALKTHQLATEPVPGISLLESRWFLVGVVELELLLGLWLVSGWQAGRARTIALVLGALRAWQTSAWGRRRIRAARCCCLSPSRAALFLGGILALAGWPGLFSSAVAQSPADTMVARIIDNVRANEELYQHLEVVVRKEYQLQSMNCARTGATKTMTVTTRSVLQSGRIYVDCTTRGNALTDMDGTADKSFEQASLLGYDGEVTTRLTPSARLANVHQERFEGCDVFRAHAWLLPRAHICFPFSLWLTGGEALKKHPLAGLHKEWDSKVTYEGREDVDGLSCVKLRIAMGPASSRVFHVLWLAVERNYLPVRMESFAPTFTNNKDHPLATARSSDFREIHAGVWLPFRRSYVVYCEVDLRKNKAVVSNTEEAYIEKVNTNPDYDLDLFRIPIPDGTKVHEMNGGKIIKSYVRGQPQVEKQVEKADPERARPRVKWMLGINLLLALVAAAVFVGTRARRRTTPPPIV